VRVVRSIFVDDSTRQEAAGTLSGSRAANG
jgi:hypothetical protein